MKKGVILFLVFLSMFGLGCGAQTYTLCEKWVDCGNSCKLLDPYYSEGVSFNWNGPSKGGKADGYGTAVKYVNGEYESTYVGEYKNGIRSGHGKFTHKDGSTKEGTFVNGQLCGYGTMTAEDGSSYEGYMLHYRFHGRGKYTWGNGSVFEGYFVADSPYTGKITQYDKSVIYLRRGEVVEKINEKRSSYSPTIGKLQREYFDENWERCAPKDAVYYRLVTYSASNTPQGKVKDYFITGELQSEYTAIFIDYADEGKNFYEGEAKWYYRSGQIEQLRYYMNSKINGPLVTYYENGTMQHQANYLCGTLDGDAIYYYENGSPSLVLKYENGQLKNNKALCFKEDGSCYLAYAENFGNNANAWEYSGQNGTVFVQDGDKVVFAPAAGRAVAGGIDTGFSQDGENIIQFTVSQNSAANSSVDILFGFRDWDNLCSIDICGRQFRFRYFQNGQSMTKELWENCDAIQAEKNRITIINTKSELSIHINDQLVWQSQSIKYSGSFCGVAADNNSSQTSFVTLYGLSVHEMVQDLHSVSEYLPSAMGTGAGDWKGSGSGFFVDSRGYIATNHHVVDGAKQIQVSFLRNGEWEHHPAKVVISDKQNDLSIVKIDDADYQPVGRLPYNFSTSIKDTGSEVFTLGYPIADVMGDEVKFTDGKISSKSGIQGDVTVYQISVPIQPGNSGGPLFDVSGNLVGITSSGLNREYFKSENVNYAVKSSYLKALIDSMTQHIQLPAGMPIADKPLTEKIKLFQEYVTLIRVK